MLGHELDAEAIDRQSVGVRNPPGQVVFALAQGQQLSGNSLQLSPAVVMNDEEPHRWRGLLECLERRPNRLRRIDGGACHDFEVTRLAQRTWLWIDERRYGHGAGHPLCEC